MSKELREQVEKILFKGLVNAEELDITTDKLMKLLESFAEEQVKKALKGDEGIEYKQGWRDGWDAANEQLKKALDKVEKCKCEMPAKIKGRKMCYRCKKYIE